MSCFIGVDPGQTGAIALIDGTGKLIYVKDMPIREMLQSRKVVDAAVLRAYFYAAQQGESVVGIEDVHSMPGQGVSSTFKFGHMAGAPLYVAMSLDLGVQFVSPQRWKRHFSLIGSEKDEARHLATELYPAFAEQLRRKKDIGRADAILIARYIFEKNNHV